MADNIKYKEIEIPYEKMTLMIKFTYREVGKFGTPDVKIRVMEYHKQPTTWFGRLWENIAYTYDSMIWDPKYDRKSLEKTWQEFSGEVLSELISGKRHFDEI